MTTRLSGDQIRELRLFLLNRTNRDDLRRIVRERCDLDLDTIVETTKKFDVVVFQLITHFDKEGVISKLIDVLSQEMSAFGEELNAIRQGQTPSQQQAMNLADLRRFRAEFRSRRDSIVFLRAYKELHELLHNLDGLTAQIHAEALARTQQGTPIPEPTADDLMQWAEDAEVWWVNTDDPNSPPLCVWVPRFEKSVKNFLGDDPAKHPQALANILQLPGQQLGPLNRKLVDCAKRLKVSVLLEILDELPITDPKLMSAVASFRDPCERLLVMIKGHDLCQQIDSELRVTVLQPTSPSVAVSNWDEVLEWFRMLDNSGLRDSRVGNRRITRTLQAVDTFVATSSVAAFNDLVEKFNDLFKRVDETLLEVTQQLVDAADPLSDKLEGVR